VQRARFVMDTSGPALKRAGLGIYLLKPSLRELTDLTGREIRKERDEKLAARQVIEQGRCEILVLSLGAQGALLATADGCQRFAAIPVEARSTVGAGDSMLAGIVLGLSRGLPLRDAVRFGMAAGAAALLGTGTQLCRRSDVERLYADSEYLGDAGFKSIRENADRAIFVEAITPPTRSPPLNPGLPRPGFLSDLKQTDLRRCAGSAGLSARREGRKPGVRGIRAIPRVAPRRDSLRAPVAGSRVR